MNDPFAMLNPIDKPKTAPVYGGPPAAPVAPVHHPVGGFGGGGAPGAGMGMGMNMGMGMGMGMPMGGGMPGGMMGGGGFGGMAPGMGGGMAPGMGGGMAPGMGGMGQQQPPVQAPIMYDNIKNLLNQKPKPSGTMRDDTSMDFLENMGSAKANSVSMTSPTAAASPFATTAPAPVAHHDPFGGPAPAVSVTTTAAPVSLGAFEFPGESTASSSTTVSPSNASGKSGALADRLANGRRKTQEAQRQQLGFNAGAFNTTGAPRISLKDMAPQSSSKSPSSQDRESRAPSLEDFASGKPVFVESDPFGASPSAFNGNSSRTNSRTSSQPKPTHQPASAFDNDGGSIFADSDADFESKLNGGSGSSRHLSGNLSGSTRTGSGSARTGSGSASAATMDFGW